MDYDGTLEELAGAMEYLHRERRGRMDSRNLIAAIRGAGDVQQEHAIMLGFESLGKNPDPRMVRTLITYLNRENRPSESFRLLGYMPKSHWRQEMERILQIRMNGPPPSHKEMSVMLHGSTSWNRTSKPVKGWSSSSTEFRLRRRMRRRRLA